MKDPLRKTNKKPHATLLLTQKTSGKTPRKTLQKTVGKNKRKTLRKKNPWKNRQKNPRKLHIAHPTYTQYDPKLMFTPGSSVG